jgi:hypothetical protein
MHEAMWIAIGMVSALVLIKRKLKMQAKTMIKIQGHLNGKWEECFNDLKISYEGNNTVLTGKLNGEAHLYRILNIIQNNNLTLISINPEERFNKKGFF